MRKKNNDLMAMSLALAATVVTLAGLGFVALRWLDMPDLSSKPGVVRSGDMRSGNMGPGDALRHAETEVVLTALGDSFSGYSTLRSDAFQSSLVERGIGLDYRHEFDQAMRAHALHQGEVDLIVTTLDQFLTYQPQGKIVGLIDRTVGADAVVLNTQRHSELQSLIDLEAFVQARQAKGQRTKIVYAGGTPSEFLAMVLDTSFDNFNLADFEIVQTEDAGDAWALFQKDPDVALAVLWEPFVTEAQNQGNTVVLSSADVPKVIVDVVVASDRVLQTKPEAVQQFVEAYYRRIDRSLQDSMLLNRQIALDGDLSPEQAQSVAQGIHFFTSVEAEQWMNAGMLDRRIQSISGVLTLSGRAEPLNTAPATLYTDEFVAPIAQQTTGLIDAIAADNPQLAQRLQDQTQPVLKTVSTAQVNQADPIGHLKVKGEVKFQTGSAQLAAESQQALVQLAREIGEFSPNTVGVKIQGHTSRTGSAALNQTLSEQRATAVSEYLQAQLPHHFASEGLGFSHPLPQTDPASPLNQRTVVRLVRIGG